MKKKYFFVCIFLLFVVNTQAQVIMSLIFGKKLNSDRIEFGLEGGGNLSQIYGLDSSTPLWSYNIGFYFDIVLKDQWTAYTGVLVKAQMGTNKLSDEDLTYLEIIKQPEEGTYSQRLNSFLVPAMLRYNFKNRIYVGAGFQFGLIHQASVRFESDLDGVETRIREFNKDKINRIDAGVSVSTGYRLKPRKGMSVGLRYYYGFVNTYKGRSGTKNTTLIATLTIPIGAGKNKEKETK